MGASVQPELDPFTNVRYAQRFVPIMNVWRAMPWTYVSERPIVQRESALADLRETGNMGIGGTPDAKEKKVFGWTHGKRKKVRFWIGVVKRERRREREEQKKSNDA